MKKQLIRFMLLSWGLAFAPATSIGQALPAKLDSAIATLGNMPADTQKVLRLLDIGVIYLNQSENSKANQYYNDALVLSEKLDYPRGQAIAHGNIGIVEYNLGRYENALRHLSTSLQIILGYNDRKLIANNYSNIGMVYSKQGQFDKAIEAYTTALAYRSETDQRGKSAAYNNLGIIHFQKGDYAKALEYYLLSLQIDEALGDNKLDLAFSNNNVGMVYAYQKDYAKAISYYKKANALCTDVQHLECIAGTSSNIAELLKEQGQLPEALEYYNGALATFEQIGNPGQIGMTMGNIGSIYHAIGDYERALQYYTHALQLVKSVGDLNAIPIALTNLGSLNRDMHRYPEAHAQLTESIALFKKTGAKADLQDTYLRLSMLDSMMGNFNDALVHFKLHKALQDSIENEANFKVLAEIREKYESEKKDKAIIKLENEKSLSELQSRINAEHLALTQSEQQQILIQNKLQQQQIVLLDKDKRLQALELEKNAARLAAQEIESQQKEAQLALLNQQNEIKNLRLRRQQQLQWYSIAGFILFGLIGILYYLNHQTRQKLKLQMLRNKIAIDLHDHVGSTLSSISIFSQMAKQQSRDINPLLDSIGENSRKMLDAMADIVWTINPENDQFEKIILRMRSFAYELLGAKNIEFEFNAEEEISNLKLPMDVRKNLYLIFKEATNNLVKYAEANKATFAIKEDKNMLSMMIRDNGKGFDLTGPIEGNGIKNMRKRAEEIGGRLLIDSVPGSGTTIQLQIAI